jgi:alkylation response protein AidB-like acyl-CoA dehydrogenase
MDLELNEEQQMLSDSAAALLASKSLSGARGEASADGVGLRTDVWRQAAELGLTALNVPERFDGMGAGPGELYATMVAVGRNVSPEPFIDLAYLPAWLLEDLGTEEQQRQWLPQIASGEALVSVAHAEPGRSWDLQAQLTASTAPDGGVTLSGTKSPVRFADSATAFLVTGSEDGESGVYLVDAGAAGISRIDGRTADWSRASALTFDGTPAERLGTEAAGPAIRRAYARARVALGAEAVGLMHTGLDLTVEYLKSRKQFGVPLARFQALVHRAADLYATVELARSMVLWATAQLEAAQLEDGDYEEGMSLEGIADDTFVFVSDCARQVAEESIQLHGGIGMTYEAEVSHVAARLVAITQSYGGIVEVRHRALASASPVTSPSALRHNGIAPEVYALR